MTKTKVAPFYLGHGVYFSLHVVLDIAFFPTKSVLI